jgi:hypothetical protein
VKNLSEAKSVSTTVMPNEKHLKISLEILFSLVNIGTEKSECLLALKNPNKIFFEGKKILGIREIKRDR